MQPVSLYIPANSLLHRCHPLTKLTGASCALSLGFLAAGQNWASLIFVAVILPLSIIGKVSWRLVTSLLKLLSPIAFFLFLLHGFFYPDGATVLLRLGDLNLTQEGIRYAWQILTRLLLLSGTMLLFVFTTDANDLLLALTQCGFPTTLAYLFTSTLQLLPQLQTRAKQILAAQQARGLATTGNLGQRSRALLPLIAPLVLSALAEAEERAMALEARGFRLKRRKTSLVQLADSLWQRRLRFILIIFTVGFIGVSHWRL